jgi:hypothetical protein
MRSPISHISHSRPRPHPVTPPPTPITPPPPGRPPSRPPRIPTPPRILTPCAQPTHHHTPTPSASAHPQTQGRAHPHPVNGSPAEKRSREGAGRGVRPTDSIKTNTPKTQHPRLTNPRKFFQTTPQNQDNQDTHQPPQSRNTHRIAPPPVPSEAEKRITGVKAPPVPLSATRRRPRREASLRSPLSEIGEGARG